jgi:hypothetical protein
MKTYLTIGWILVVVATISYLWFKVLRLIKVVVSLRQTEAELTAKITELELKQVEFAIKEAEYQEQAEDNTKTIAALEKLVASQDKLLDAYRDDELY